MAKETYTYYHLEISENLWHTTCDIEDVIGLLTTALHCYWVVFDANTHKRISEHTLY